MLKTSNDLISSNCTTKHLNISYYLYLFRKLSSTYFFYKYKVIIKNFLFHFGLKLSSHYKILNLINW